MIEKLAQVYIHPLVFIFMEPEKKRTPRVYTGGKLVRVPNQPKTPLRAIRVNAELWQKALAAAKEDGTNLSEVIRSLLEDWLKKRARRKP
jgi:hypothetical protein